jgi:hypothetical protein
MTTIRQNLAAVTLTANAKAVGEAAGVNLASLQTQLDSHLVEAAILLKQIIALHPSGGGDAANLTALQNLLVSLTT